MRLKFTYGALISCLMITNAYATNYVTTTETTTKETTTNTTNSKSHNQTETHTDTIETEDSKLSELPTSSAEETKKSVEAEMPRINYLITTTMDNLMSRSDKNGQYEMEILNKPGSESTPIQNLITADDAEESETLRRQLETNTEILKSRKPIVTEAQANQFIEDQLFPVTTRMKPTRLPSRVIGIDPIAAKELMTPIAIIGDDEYSLSWFRLNLGALRRMHASVIVTSVKNMNDFQMIKAFAPDLEIQPLSAESFLKAFNISTYPILLTRQGAIQ